MRPLLLIIYFFYSTFSRAQKADRYNVYVNIDDSIVVRHRDSLLNKTNEIIIFQTLRPFTFVQSSDSILTFILWRQNKNCSAIILNDTKVYAATSFNGNAIFDYPKKSFTYVTKDEDVLKFTPPIIGNAVYFFTKKNAHLFELTGQNDQPWTYVPNNKKKENARKEYFELIYKTLGSQKFDLLPKGDNKRNWQ